MNTRALEKTRHKAQGLHKEAQFGYIGGNNFVVHLGGEEDWKHALNNEPSQFDFNVIVLKDYEGNTRPSEMIFDMVMGSCNGFAAR